MCPSRPSRPSPLLLPKCTGPIRPVVYGHMAIQASAFRAACIENPANAPPCSRRYVPAAERLQAYSDDFWRASVCAAHTLQKLNNSAHPFRDSCSSLLQGMARRFEKLGWVVSAIFFIIYFHSHEFIFLSLDRTFTGCDQICSFIGALNVFVSRRWLWELQPSSILCTAIDFQKPQNSANRRYGFCGWLSAQRTD